MIQIPDAIWARLLDEFERFPSGVERVGYLDGFRFPDSAVVTTAVFPDADCYPGYYTVSPEAMSEAGQHFRRHGMVRLAQVHTHGMSWVDHSPRDDAMAYSQLVGAISIVLPDHAKGRPLPTDRTVGVLIKEKEGWRRLPLDEVLQQIQVVPGFLDFRRKVWTYEKLETDTLVTRRDSARSILRRLFGLASR